MTIHQCKGCGELTRREAGYCDRCEYMTQAEAAARLHVSKPTYYRMVRAGKIRPRRVSTGKILVWRPEVELLLSCQFAPKFVFERE